jgi:hypothetical protein
VKKYLVFKNNPVSRKSNIPGSHEDFACEIAGVVERTDAPKDSFIAYLADSPEATFSLIQSRPLFSIELDQARINAWTSDAKPLHEKICNFGHAINDARKLMACALCELEDSAKASIIFKDINLTDEISISCVFDEMGQPNRHNFTERLNNEFNVEVFKQQTVWSP